jgi:hypothetical protein
MPTRARCALRRGIPLMLGLVFFSPVGAGAAKTAVPCRHTAAVFRERLEPVVEAAIDGRPKRAAAAADSALAWWGRHAHRFGRRAVADSLLQAMGTAAHGNRPNHAANFALRVSEETFAWCPEPATLEDQLMRIDLVGEAAWRRAHGIAAPWPDLTRDAVSAIRAALPGASGAALADSLEASVGASLRMPVAAHGDAAAASALLDLVDALEKEILR